MAKITINDIPVEIEEGTTVLQACESIGVEIPVFCYHRQLSIAGNCRMCLVELEKSPKPIASCAMPAADGMVIHTDTPMVKKARKGVLEFLLINHPLDCPICDQGGECDLQDLTVSYGPSKSRFEMNKRAVRDKYMGPLIKTIMTRCIHCTRCVRFSDEIAGVPDMGALGRGEDMEITTYLEKATTSELSGNMIDICPVGALTNKPYSFEARPWELIKTNSIDVLDAVGSNIRIDTRDRNVMRILPRINDDINEEWISDKTRFAYDGLVRQRLDRPFVRLNTHGQVEGGGPQAGGRLVETSWHNALGIAADHIKSISPHEVAVLSGDLADCESVTVLKDILHKLDISHFDCRQDGTCHDVSNRSSYLFNSTIAGIDETDFILLIATNVRHEAPIINARIRKRYLQNGLKDRDISIATLGPKFELTYPYDYLGEQVHLLKEIVEGTHPICSKLKNAKKPMMILGQGALNRRDSLEILRLSQEIAEKYNFIQPDWNGFNVLHTAAGRVGALDLGFASSSSGADTASILSGCQKGRFKVVLLNGVDEIHPNQFGSAFVIYLGHHGDVGAHRADIILPGLAYTEKSATYVNTEGRPQQTNKAVAPPGQAQEDWFVLTSLADALDLNLGYRTLDQVRARMAEINPIFSKINEITPAPWKKIVSRVPETLSHLPFKSPIDNFYMTDPISRHSAIMAQCVDEIGTTTNEPIQE